MGFSAPALVAAEPSEAHGGSQFPELGLLLHGDAEGLTIQFLGGIGMTVTEQELAFAPVQLSREPMLPCPFCCLQGIVQ